MSGRSVVISGMAQQPIDFFAQAKARSLHKLDIYSKYLQPLVFKWGQLAGPTRPGRHIWLVDGFAGAGRYQPDDGGRTQDGSPLIAAKWARQIALDRRYPLVRCINVERDAQCFADLERNLAPWTSGVDVAINLRGDFSGHLDLILETIGNDPALVFLDPFGLHGIEMELIERALARAGKTEFIIHFSDKTFLRMAGHLDDNDQRLPVGQKVAESKLARLDAVIGNRLWRRIWTDHSRNTDEAIEATIKLYLSELRLRIGYAHGISIRDTYNDRPAYRLVFCTESPHGVELMSDIAYRYETGLKEQHDAGTMTLWEDQEARQRLTDLRDAVHSAGLRSGTASREQIIHELAPHYFGQYTSTHYAKAIRELVTLGLIERETSVGIEPREPLRFIEPAQGSLLLSS
jgi:three-Cys-motif partner protein